MNEMIIVRPEKCVGCKQCMKIACPSLAFDTDNKKAYVADFTALFKSLLS